MTDSESEKQKLKDGIRKLMNEYLEATSILPEVIISNRTPTAICGDGSKYQLFSTCVDVYDSAEEALKAKVNPDIYRYNDRN